MKRSIRIMLVPLLLVAAVGGGNAAAAAPAVSAPAANSPAMRTFDCDTEGPEWPSKAAVRGATFLGRVKDGYEASPNFRSYRLKVIWAYNGDFGKEVRVAIQCATTKLQVGQRYLFSSGQFATRDGQITHLSFFEDYGVGWRVRDDSTVKLLGYGAGTQTAPQWLKSPDTVKQAVRAIYPH